MPRNTVTYDGPHPQGMALMDEARDRMHSASSWAAAIAVGQKYKFPDELILYALVGEHKATELMATHQQET